MIFCHFTILNLYQLNYMSYFPLKITLDYNKFCFRAKLFIPFNDLRKLTSTASVKSKGDKKQTVFHSRHSVSITQKTHIYDELTKCILSSILFPFLLSHSGNWILMKEENHFQKHNFFFIHCQCFYFIRSS